MRSWLEKRIVGRHYEKWPSAFSFLAEKGGFASKVKYDSTFGRSTRVFSPFLFEQTALGEEGIDQVKGR
jgi:hypothetical protein